MTNKTNIWLGVLGILILASSIVYVHTHNLEEPGPVFEEVATVPTEATITGSFTCLPHRNTDGPQTLECASGLETNDGNFYALDLSAFSYPADEFGTGEAIKVTGLLVPIEQISSDMWQKYNIKGIMRVTNITK